MSSVNRYILFDDVGILKPPPCHPTVGKKTYGEEDLCSFTMHSNCFSVKKKAIKVVRHRVHREECESTGCRGVALYVRCGVLCLNSLFFRSFCPSYFVKHGLQDDNENCRPVSAAIMEFRDGCHHLNHNGIKEGGQSTDWKQVTRLGGGLEKDLQREHKGWQSSLKDLFTKSWPEFCKAWLLCFDKITVPLMARWWQWHVKELVTLCIYVHSTRLRSS